VSPPRAPYSLEPNAFSFPALANLAGRAPLGGPRELALACLLVCRIVRDTVLTPDMMAPEQLAHRVAMAKNWLGTAAIQAQTKGALTRIIDAAARRDTTALRNALDAVTAVTANHLDQGARLELGRLAQTVVE
jgi:hypothetical protein